MDIFGINFLQNTNTDKKVSHIDIYQDLAKKVLSEVKPSAETDSIGTGKKEDQPIVKELEKTSSKSEKEEENTEKKQQTSENTINATTEKEEFSIYTSLENLGLENTQSLELMKKKSVMALYNKNSKIVFKKSEETADENDDDKITSNGLLVNKKFG